MPPLVFQAFVNEVLGEFLEQLVIVYIDNILGFSHSEAKHDAEESCLSQAPAVHISVELFCKWDVDG